MKKIKITRQELERLGITEITPSGKIYMGKVEKRPFKIWAKHKWGNDKYYWGISIYDPLLHEEQVKKGCKTRNGVRIFLLHRVIWAWFYGETPDNMDVCHVDDDPDNNCIYFLEVKTHQQNLYERKGNRSKFTTEKWKAEHPVD